MYLSKYMFDDIFALHDNHHHTIDLLWEKFQWILPLYIKPISFQSKASVVCSVTEAIFIDFCLKKLNAFSLTGAHLYIDIAYVRLPLSCSWECYDSLQIVDAGTHFWAFLSCFSFQMCFSDAAAIFNVCVMFTSLGLLTHCTLEDCNGIGDFN